MPIDNRVLSALSTHAYELLEAPIVGNESRFFTAELAYPSHFTAVHGLRPHLRIEMSFQPPALGPVNRPIQSIIALAQKQDPEVLSFPCVNPVETAADKLSALAWLVCTRQRNVEGDDPTIVRHLYDLAALESRVGSAPEFAELVLQTTKRDTERGGGKAPPEPLERFDAMLNLLQHDKAWAKEYEDFVLQVSFAGPGETVSFDDALIAVSLGMRKCTKNGNEKCTTPIREAW